MKSFKKCEILKLCQKSVVKIEVKNKKTNLFQTFILVSLNIRIVCVFFNEKLYFSMALENKLHLLYFLVNGISFKLCFLNNSFRIYVKALIIETNNNNRELLMIGNLVAEDFDGVTVVLAGLRMSPNRLIMSGKALVLVSQAV